ncbi:MAG: YihY/virulence factor BrkB family protein [Gemmatimonadaceae bacterium]
MATRPLVIRLGWTLRDYAKRVFDNAGEDNVFFLAGGIAFNILLAAVPFVLLLISGLGYVLNQSPDAASADVWALLHRLLPPHQETEDSNVHKLLNDIIRARGQIGFWSLVTFIWFSTRLFGSLRSVLCEVFDIEQDRGIVAGKVFDAKITVIATGLFAGYTAVSAYLALARSRWDRLLATYGVRRDLMGEIEFRFGQLLAFAFIVLMFFALYKFLPNRRVRWQTALIGAVFTSVLFELAKAVFTEWVNQFNPGSIYSGTLYAIVIVVSWVYYAATIFVLGGEVGQVYELRRVRRLQREVLERA